jgi:hypothetical protein
LTALSLGKDLKLFECKLNRFVGIIKQRSHQNVSSECQTPASLNRTPFQKVSNKSNHYYQLLQTSTPLPLPLRLLLQPLPQSPKTSPLRLRIYSNSTLKNQHHNKYTIHNANVKAAVAIHLTFLRLSISKIAAVLSSW